MQQTVAPHASRVMDIGSQTEQMHALTSRMMDTGSRTNQVRALLYDRQVDSVATVQ